MNTGTLAAIFKKLDETNAEEKNKAETVYVPTTTLDDVYKLLEKVMTEVKKITTPTTDKNKEPPAPKKEPLEPATFDMDDFIGSHQVFHPVESTMEKITIEHLYQAKKVEYCDLDFISKFEKISKILNSPKVEDAITIGRNLPLSNTAQLSWDFDRLTHMSNSILERADSDEAFKYFLETANLEWYTCTIKGYWGSFHQEKNPDGKNGYIEAMKLAQKKYWARKP